MLEETKKLYEEMASRFIPNWKRMDRNKLFNQYILYEDQEDLREACLSAIICRYWSSLKGYINRCYLNINKEELYDAFIESLLYTLRKRAWLDSSSSVYGDPNGPDKCFNIHLKCMIWNVEAKHLKMKHKANTSSIDLEELEGFEPSIDDDKQIVHIYDYIHRCFEGRDYVTAFITHYIMYGDVFRDQQLDKKRLCKRLRNIDDFECKQIKTLYQVADLQAAQSYVLSLTTRQLYNRIELFLQKGRSHAGGFVFS